MTGVPAGKGRGSATVGGMGALLDALQGPDGAGAKLPLREAIIKALTDDGFDYVLVSWKSGTAISVSCLSGSSIHVIDAEAPGPTNSEAQLDSLYDQVVARAREIHSRVATP